MLTVRPLYTVKLGHVPIFSEHRKQNYSRPFYIGMEEELKLVS